MLLVDVLHQMIQQDPKLSHPLDYGAPCPVLQYADDTLILLRAKPAAARRLKQILDDFFLTTGLQISFHKSTLVPIHVEAPDLASIKLAGL